MRDYLRIIRKRLGLILGVALLVIAAVAAKTFLERPVYVAAATVLVEREARSFNPLEPMPIDYYDPSEFFQTQIRIIRSRPLAQRVVEGLNLRARKPEFAQARIPPRPSSGPSRSTSSRTRGSSRSGSRTPTRPWRRTSPTASPTPT